MKTWKSKLGKFALCIALFALAPTVASAQCYYPNSGGCCPPPCRPSCPPPRCNYVPAPCYQQPCTPCPAPCYQPCNPCPTYNDCNDQQSCNISGVEIGADFLWWKPCVNDLEFAITDRDYTEMGTIRSDGRYHAVCPKWEPGVKAHITVPSQCGKWGFRGSYVWVHSQDNQRATQGDEDGSSIYNPLYRPELDFAFTQVRSNWDTTYHNFDAVLSFAFSECECQTISPFFGIGGLFLDQTLKTTMDDPALTVSDKGTTKWDSYYWGLGLTVGSDYEYAVCEGFKFFGTGKATLVAGEPDTNNTQTLTTGEVTLANLQKLKNSKPCHLVPGYHLASGIEYNSCGCGLNMGVRIGYEFVRWHNVPNPRVWITSDEFTSTHPSVGTYGFHGLFAGLNISF